MYLNPPRRKEKKSPEPFLHSIPSKGKRSTPMPAVNECLIRHTTFSKEKTGFGIFAVNTKRTAFMHLAEEAEEVVMGRLCGCHGECRLEEWMRRLLQ